MSADPNDPSSKVDLERRRVPLERKISLKFKEFRGFITEYSQNLSMGGMFIRTTAPKPVGTIFDFELSLTDDFKLVQGIGEVIWVRETDDGAERPSGMGVRFLDLSSESRRLIQRIVEEQVAHGGTPFELEPPGFPPPPLRQTPTAPKPKTGTQSTLFHPTAAPVAPVPPLPGRPGGATSAAPATPTARPPAAAAPAAPASRAAAAQPAAAPPPSPAPAPPSSPAPPRAAAPTPPAAAALPDIDAFPDLGAPELPIPELTSERSELLPALDDFDRQSLEGFDLVDERAELASRYAEPPTQHAGAEDVDDDPTPLRREPAVGDEERDGFGGAGAAVAGGAVAGAADAGAADAASPGGWPRGRGLPSGFDEVARAFSDPPKTVDPHDETVRLTRLEMPPEPSRPSTPPPPSPAPPRIEPPRPARPAQAPARRPARRRRSWFLPVAAAVLLLLAGGFALVYLRFPELLPEWVRAPKLDDATIAENAPPRRVLPRRREAAAAPSPLPASSAGIAVAPVPPQAGLVPPATASPAPTAASAPSGALAGAAPAGPTGAASTPPRPGAPDTAPRGRFSTVEEIWGQRSNVGTVITIVTDGTVPTEAFSHFRLDGGSPRQVIRLRDVDDRYRRTNVPVNTAEVKQVRLGYHARPGGNELHIVLDLGSPQVQLVRLTPVDNRLELVLAQH